MAKYRYVIFDFDGTIDDTSEGIYHTFKKVLDILGVGYESVDFSRHIGPPLKFSYTTLVGEELCDRAIQLHRKIFADDNAIEMSCLYDGITDVLSQLQRKGFLLAVASSKYQPHALDAIARLGLQGFFHAVYGQNEKRGYKAEVLRQLICDNGWEKSKCIMIGDTFYDIEGAHENGIDAMAVTYGFGRAVELEKAKAEFTAHSPQEIAELLLGEK